VPGALLSNAATVYPTPWIIAASLLSGAALSSATRRTRGEADPEAAWSRKWVRALLLCSASVAVWLLAVFVPGPEKAASAKYVVFFLAATAVFGLGFRFKKTAGLLLMVGMVVGTAVGYFFSTALQPYSGETEIGRVVVYAVRDGAMDVEVRAAGQAPAYARLVGDRVVALVDSIRFDDLWPGLGWRSWYRSEGLTAFALVDRSGKTSVVWHQEPYLFERPSGVPEALYRFFRKHAAAMPGVRIIRSDALGAAAAQSPDSAGFGRVEELREYALLLGADGAVATVAVGR